MNDTSDIPPSSETDTVGGRGDVSAISVADVPVADVPVTDAEPADSGGPLAQDTSVSPQYACGDDGLYTPSSMSDWRVCVSVDLQSTAPALCAQVLAKLKDDLMVVDTLLSPAAVGTLHDVNIWVERDVPTAAGAVYHPPPTWLVNNG